MPRGLASFILPSFLMFLPPASAQTMVVPKSIHAEEVPPIPASLSAALNRYQNIRVARFQDWDDSKGGRAMIGSRRASTSWESPTSSAS
jgi:hypothetical protein